LSSLDDLGFDLIADVRLQVADAAHLHQRGGQEAAQADVEDQAALDDLDHRAGDHAVLFLDLLDRAPGALVLGALLGQIRRPSLSSFCRTRASMCSAGLDDVVRVDVMLDGQFA